MILERLKKLCIGMKDDQLKKIIMLKNEFFRRSKLLVKKINRFFKAVILRKKKRVRMLFSLVFIIIGFWLIVSSSRTRDVKDPYFLSANFKNKFSSKTNLERFTKKTNEFVQQDVTLKDVEFIADSYMNIDDFIPQLISMRHEIKSLTDDNKVSMVSVVFNIGLFKKISNKLRENEEIFIKNEFNALKAIQILEGDMKKAKTMGNVMATLATTTPILEELYNRINTARFLTQNIKADLSDLQSVMYAKLSVILALLGIFLAIIGLL